MTKTKEYSPTVSFFSYSCKFRVAFNEMNLLPLKFHNNLNINFVFWIFLESNE